MKKIMWAVSFISLIGTTIVLQFMPDTVPMHYDMAGNIDRWGSRYESLVFPIIILAFSLFWTLFINYYEKKALNTADEKESAGAKTNAKVLGIAGALMAVVFTVMQGFLLYGSFKEAVSGAEKQSVDIGRISVILIGIVIIVLGNFMTKTRINSAVGVRISWSMYNDTTWRMSNRFGAFALMIAGVAAIVTAVFMKNAFAAMMVTLGYVAAAVILTVIYAHKVYVQERTSERKE